jgi:hypothetical protein
LYFHSLFSCWIALCSGSAQLVWHTPRSLGWSISSSAALRHTPRGALGTSP